MKPSLLCQPDLRLALTESASIDLPSACLAVAFVPRFSSLKRSTAKRVRSPVRD